MKNFITLQRYWKLSVVSSLVLSGAIILPGNYAWSQVVQEDSTLGSESSLVTSPIPGEFLIEGGATRGTNLFHSFSEFSVPSNGIAYFNNAVDIQNIISRVTGGSVSNIDGLIKANGTANLFLINPNGIIFGPNASLDVKGSFVASTADSLVFDDGFAFSATVPQAPPLLTISTPLGLQYGSNVGSIQVQGATLQVPNGKTLALVGGNVQLNGAYLEALGGRVELGGVAGTGTVGLSIDGNDLRLSFPNGVALSDVSLTNDAIVDVIAGGGSIVINAQNLNMEGESALLAGIAPGLGSADSRAGDIEIKATGIINLTDGSLIDNSVLEGGVGKGGDINITTGQLLVSDGSQVSTSTSGSGDGGSLIINASDSVQVIGTSADGNYISALGTLTFGTGAAGNVEIITGQLLVSDGAEVGAKTFASGKGGDLIINASDSVQVIGTSPDGQSRSALFASTYETGEAGKLEITTRQLLVSNGAVVSASTFASGTAGDLIVNASDSVQLIGTSADSKSRSGLFASTYGTGKAGNLEITTGQLLIFDGARVSASTFGDGDGGSLIINASDSVQVIGTSPDGKYPSGLLTETRGTGEAGNLEITTRQLLVSDGAQVSASTFSSGKGGSLIINASDSVQLIGTSAEGSLKSGLFVATASNATGNGGNIYLSTNNLDLSNGAVISAQSLGSGRAGGITINANQTLNLNNGEISVTADLSDAGNIEIQASSVRLDNGASINANTKGGQGNINLNSDDLVLRHGSNITTNAEGESVIGGNINIDTGVLVALENSDISANSRDFRGGNVIVTAQGIFGTEFREQLTPESDITASGKDSSLNGTVEINTPDVDPSRGLVELPVEPVNVEVAQGCQAAGKPSLIAFFNTGKGGLAPNPYEPLSTSDIWEDVSSPTQRTAALASANSGSASPATLPDKIEEAQGWLINEKGQVVFVAEMPTTESQSRCRLR